MIHSPIRSPLRSPIRSPLARAIAAGLPGTYYDFTGSTLPAPWDTLRRAGLGTRIDAAGAVGYGAHNLLARSWRLSSWSANGTPTYNGNGTPIAGFQTGAFSTTAFGNGYFQNITAVAGTTYTIAYYVRRTAGAASLTIGTDSLGQTFATFNPANGTFSAGPTDKGAIDLGGGAWLAWVRYTPSTGGTLSVLAYVWGGASTYDLAAWMTVSTALVPYIETDGSAVYLPRPTHNPSTLAALGLLIEGQATQLAQSGNLGAAFITQTKTVTAVAHTISFYGTGSVVLSGVHSATVNGTGTNVLTSLTFTPSAGSLTMTVSGTVTDGQLETGTVATSRIPNPTTGTALRTGDFAGGGISGAALSALLTPTAPFTIVLPFRKSYSLASVETLLGLCAGASAGTTNQLGIATNGTQAQLVHSGGSGALTGTLVLDGSTVNKVAVSVDPTARGAELATTPYTGSSTGAWSFGADIRRNGTTTLPATLTSVAGMKAAGSYLVTFDVADFSGDGFTLDLNGVSSGIGQVTGNGPKSYVINTSASGSPSILFVPWAGTAGQVTITNLSVRRVGAMSISVNGSAPVETTGIAYTGSGTTHLIPGARDSSGGQAATGFTSPGIRVASGYITGSALQALSV